MAFYPITITTTASIVLTLAVLLHIASPVCSIPHDSNQQVNVTAATAGSAPRLSGVSSNSSLTLSKLSQSTRTSASRATTTTTTTTTFSSVSSRQQVGSSCSSDVDCGDQLRCYNSEYAFCLPGDSSCRCAVPCTGPETKCYGVCGTVNGGNPVCFKCGSSSVEPYGGDECGSLGKPCESVRDCNSEHICADSSSYQLCTGGTCLCALMRTTSASCQGMCGSFPPLGPSICLKCTATGIGAIPVDDNQTCESPSTTATPTPVPTSPYPSSDPLIPTSTPTPTPTPSASRATVQPPTVSEAPPAPPTTISTPPSPPPPTNVPSPSSTSSAVVPTLGTPPSPSISVPPSVGSGEEGSPGSSEPCVDARLLAHLPPSELVFSTHRRASVMCDAYGSCATAGHIVVTHGGRAMMMGTYCRSAGTGCTKRVMDVNSPRMSGRAVRVAGKTHHLSFTAFSARYETRAEEVVLSTLVHAGM